MNTTIIIAKSIFTFIFVLSGVFGGILAHRSKDETPLAIGVFGGMIFSLIPIGILALIWFAPS